MLAVFFDGESNNLYAALLFNLHLNWLLMAFCRLDRSRSAARERNSEGRASRVQRDKEGTPYTVGEREREKERKTKEKRGKQVERRTSERRAGRTVKY